MRTPSLARRLGFDIDGALQPFRVEIMMIGRRGAAGQHQFHQRELGGQVEMLGRQARPDGIERLQPGEQLLVDGLRVGAGQRLVEMMMRVDEAGEDDVAARVPTRVNRRLRRGAGGHKLGNAAGLDHETAFGALGQNGARGLDP